VSQLYLIRHASPAIQPNAPATQWPLSARGQDEARSLAAVAQEWGLRTLYTSNEIKAQSTALIVGEACGLQPHVVAGFEELRFDEWIRNADEFAGAVRHILEAPDESFRGAERASAAATRFAGGIALIRHAPMPAAVVSHGRVLAAYLALQARQEDAFTLWRSIPMPAWALLDVGADPPRLLEPFQPVV
jgi:broad specificity phosphatase PhoE